MLLDYYLIFPYVLAWYDAHAIQWLKHPQNSDQIFLLNAAEREAYLKLKRFLESPPDIVEVFKKLIFSEDSTHSRELRNNLQQQIINILVSFILYY